MLKKCIYVLAVIGLLAMAAAGFDRTQMKLGGAVLGVVVVLGLVGAILARHYLDKRT